ncbi:MAG: FGGY family carbohydrate kinase, partial [Thermoguttaceae bacterium]
MPQYLLGTDNGCTVAKAALFTLDGREVAVASRKNDTLSPQPGWTEIDMDGAWRATTASIRDVLANAFFGAFSDGRLFSPSMGCIGNLAARGVYDVSGLTALSL